MSVGVWLTVEGLIVLDRLVAVETIEELTTWLSVLAAELPTKLPSPP